MMPITLFEFYYLSPIIIIGCAIVILLFLLLLLRISTKVCAAFSVVTLLVALGATLLLGYQLISTPKHLFVTSDTSITSIASVADASDAVTPAESNALAGSSNQNSLVTPVVESENVTATETVPSNNSDALTEDAAEPSTASTESANDLILPLNSDLSSIEQDNHGVLSHSWQATYVTALFTCDGYGLLYTSLILFICIIVAVLAYQWFERDFSDQGLFYLVLLFSALGGIILVYASHLISLFIGIELLSIPLVGLIGFQYTQTNAIEAAIKYMVLSAVATLFLLLGIAFYYAATGELTFSGLSYQLSTQAYPSSLLLTGVCLMLVGIGFKLSLVPFQLWLPDVYQGAPTVISLWLTTVGKMAVFCAVARLFLLAPIVNNETIRLILMLMAFCSILFGNFFALTQKNTKRLLAYASVANFGYLFIALIAVQYQVLALETIGIYLVSYVLANICVFGVISLESSSLKHRDSENEVDLRGLFWRRPMLALSMGIGLLSLAGIPLTIGFMSRFSLILLSATAEFWWLVGAIILGSALGLYFYLRLVINLYLRSDNCRDENLEQNTQFDFRKIGVSEVIIVGSALLILFCGIYPQPLFTLVSAAQYLIP